MSESDQHKGIPELYDSVFPVIQEKCTFYQWTDKKELEVGMLCTAPIWFEKKNKWYFSESHYDPVTEENSTWKANKFTGTNPSFKNTSYVKKHFELEQDEYLIGTHSKNRPVILIKNNISDWMNPSNTQNQTNGWLCLPLFSFKNRHNQNYVLNIQKWQSSDKIYIPPFYDNAPGLRVESVALFDTIQTINTNYLKPITSFNKEKNMDKPFRINDIPLKYILLHYYKYIGFFSEDIFNKKIIDSYDIFIELLADAMEQTINPKHLQ